jgi:thiol-disulfide isomerase/thioredoxin
MFEKNDRFGRTRRIVNTLRKSFSNMAKTYNLSVKKEEDVPKMDRLLLQPQVPFVLVKADWCGHCKNFEPKWQDLTKVPGRNANMVKMPVELQQNSQVLKNVPIDGVPTVLKVKNGTVTAVNIDEANDPDLMKQEVTRPSNVPIDGAPLANAIANENPNATEENMNEEPAGLAPTEQMEQLVNKLNINPRNLGETNGSRAENQATLNLAVPVEEPVNQNVSAQPVNSINLADRIEPATTTRAPVSIIPPPVPNTIPEPIPAPAPTPAPSLPEPASESASIVQLTPPSVVDELVNQKLKKVANIINDEQNQINSQEVKQRGGAKRRSRKQKKAKLLNMLKQFIRRTRKI